MSLNAKAQLHKAAGLTLPPCCEALFYLSGASLTGPERTVENFLISNWKLTTAELII